MDKVRVHVDPHRCVGAGQCVLAAPSVFDQGEEDGLVMLLQDMPDEAELPAVRKAERQCPAAAIKVDAA